MSETDKAEVVTGGAAGIASCERTLDSAGDTKAATIYIKSATLSKEVVVVEEPAFVETVKTPDFSKENEVHAHHALEAVKQQQGRLILEFRKPDGLRRTVDFMGCKPPLGLLLTGAPDCIVKKVEPGGHANQREVQEGWYVCSVNGENVEGLSAEAVTLKVRNVFFPSQT